jgi:hypothetical protein
MYIFFLIIYISIIINFYLFNDKYIYNYNNYIQFIIFIKYIIL